MIPEYKLFHGAVLADMIDRAEFSITISELTEEGRLLNYVINDDVALHIRYATQRLRPWGFNFTSAQMLELDRIQGLHSATFLALVCRTDGILITEWADVRTSLTINGSEQAWLRADRRKREKYRLFGPQGEFPRRFAITTAPLVAHLRSRRSRENLNNFAPHATLNATS